MTRPLPPFFYPSTHTCAGSKAKNVAKTLKKGVSKRKTRVHTKVSGWHCWGLGGVGLRGWIDRWIHPRVCTHIMHAREGALDPLTCSHTQHETHTT